MPTTATTTVSKSSNARTTVEDFVKKSSQLDLITLDLHAKNLKVDVKLFQDLEKASNRTIQRCLAYKKDKTTKPLLIELRKLLANTKWTIVKGKSARIRLSSNLMIVSGKTKVNGLYITS